jgi:hypothetical protein
LPSIAIVDLNPKTTELIYGHPKLPNYENDIFYPEKPTKSSQDCLEKLSNFDFSCTAFCAKTSIGIGL